MALGDGLLIERHQRLRFFIGFARLIERGSGDSSALCPDLIALKDRFRMEKIGLVFFMPGLGFNENGLFLIDSSLIGARVDFRAALARPYLRVDVAIKRLDHA